MRRLLAVVAVLAAVATVLGLAITQRVGATYRDGLEVTAEGADAAALGAATAEGLADDLTTLADTSATSIDEARGLLVDGAATADELGAALGTNIADAVSGTSSIADRLAGLVEAIERFIPGDSDSLAEDLRVLADGLEPVPDQLRSLGDQLAGTASDLDAATATLATIATDLDRLARSIDDARARLDEVQLLSVDLAERAERALDRSGVDLWLVRLLIVVLGVATIAATLAARRALTWFGDAVGAEGAGGGSRTHTPSGTRT